MTVADPERTTTLDGAVTRERGSAWSLVVAQHTDPAIIGRRAVLGVDPVSIGRGGDAFGVDGLDDGHLSRQHARFELGDKGTLCVVDCASRNGTHVNGKRVEMSRVRAGDIVGIGRVLLLAERVRPGFTAAMELDLPGASEPWSRCLAAVDLVAPRDHAVLLWGPSGVGKDRLAARLHAASGASGEFVALRCGGAGAGAALRRTEVDAAQSGTLYLDGIDDAPDEFQVTVLELLDHGHVRCPDTGGTRAVPLRVVASARQDPAALQGLRPDLLHRLSAWSIPVPALRRRRSDIAVLLHEFARRYAGPAARVHPELTFRLLQHSWPGNVRELEAVVERAVVESDGAVVNVFDELDHILAVGRPPAAISTMTRAAEAGRSWVVAASGQWFVRPDGTKHSLERRKVLARLLHVLVSARAQHPGRPSIVPELLAAAWPGEQFVDGSGSNRVYVALATLRRLGLRDVLVRAEGGYLIDPEAPVTIVEG